MTARPAPTLLASCAVAGLGLSVAHAAPAVTAWTTLTARLWPELTGRGRRDHVALTFDDGPDPASTPAFLATLADHEVSATFFVLGRMAAASPHLTRDLIESGHEIGVHGWSHRCLLARSPRSTYDDLARAHEVITTITGVTPRWYRPPYGVLTMAALRATRRLDLTPVLWTTWGRDWRARATADSVSADVRGRLAPGATVLLHDSDCTSAPRSWTASLAALPGLIAEIRSRGLEAGPLRDHGLRGQRDWAAHDLSMKAVSVS
ncbi:MAG: polysaccharide deacetylase family protein [Nocardioidaceae bacterium]